MNLTLSFNSYAQIVNRGFTLIELLITMAVAGILTAIAIPSYQSFVLNDRDATQINSLVYSLNYARSEAVKRNIATGVMVCPSTDGQVCNNTAAWSGGWIVTYVDPATLTATVLQSVPALAGSNTLSATGAAASGITFNSTGAVSPLPTTLAVKICDTRGSAFARDVEVNAVGRVGSSRNPGQDASGAALTCP